MTRGRPRKTEQEKKQAGTYRKDREQEINPNDKKLDQIPKPPKDLTIFELEFYNDECEFLYSVDMLTRSRHKRVLLNSMWWHLFKESQPQLRKKEGFLVTYKNGTQQVGPWLTLLKEATNALKIYFADRDKIKAPPKKLKNDFEKLLD